MKTFVVNERVALFSGALLLSVAGVLSAAALWDRGNQSSSLRLTPRRVAVGKVTDMPVDRMLVLKNNTKVAAENILIAVSYASPSPSSPLLRRLLQKKEYTNAIDKENRYA